MDAAHDEAPLEARDAILIISLVRDWIAESTGSNCVGVTTIAKGGCNESKIKKLYRTN